MLRSPCDEWKGGDNSGFTILEIADKGQSSEKLHCNNYSVIITVFHGYFFENFKVFCKFHKQLE